MSLLDVLVSKQLIFQKDIPVFQKEAESSGASYEDILLKRGITSEDILTAKGDFFHVPTRIIGAGKISSAILKYIPEESARHYQFVPLDVKDGVLEVGFLDPENIEARDALNFISTKINLPFKLFLISETEFKKVIELYKGISGEVDKALSELETELSVDDESLDLSGAEDEEGKVDTKIIEDAPVTKIVATILRYATEGNASDVHIEPTTQSVKVRFRVDGVLNTSLILPLRVHNAVVARIKVLSNMKLDEKRKPQDGRFSARIDGRKIDFRVSTFPAYYGEKVVMRILDQEKGVVKLDQMGLTPQNLALLKEAIERPYGLILISGPTGSGKTTTLYSMLNEVDREKNNVLSLEDPIEYNVEGMTQSQIRPEIGYTFANGLRTTLRQDPDIIMVGEIRDKETAQLAVQAALTGHLVFSTIHTNSAAGVIPRLIDMGIDPFLIAPTLVLAIAQRLTRKLCPGGGKPIPVEGSIKAFIENQFSDIPEKFRSQIKIPDKVFEATPTPECVSGTRGRAAVFEVIKMDKDIESVVLKGGSESDILKIAREKGMFSIRQDALLKVFKGEIAFEEVNKL